MEETWDENEVRKEEEAAAAEAGRIGGRSGMEGMDEAERARAEHGGGESEGFEEAEALLEELASHSSPYANPIRDAGAVEADEDHAVHGEPDRIESTEVDEDSDQSR